MNQKSFFEELQEGIRAMSKRITVLTMTVLIFIQWNTGKSADAELAAALTGVIQSSEWFYDGLCTIGGRWGHTIRPVSSSQTVCIVKYWVYSIHTKQR